MKFRRLIPGFLLPACLVVLTIAVGAPAHGEEDHADEPSEVPGSVLGQISFPTSTRSPGAQDAFIHGMLLLHLFEYPEARDRFLEAQKADPGFAMAYWGEAMTFNHPIWGRQDIAGGRRALLKLGPTPEQRITRTIAPREQGFLAAIELLFGAGTKAQRDLLYMRAMEQLAARYPDDHEAQLFYALSLFGVQAGVRDTATYMLCTALAQDVFSENPRHPGAAHYLIHGVDDPTHAVLGLSAARALAVMAPGAGHAQHMTSHIFMALGMWDDVVTANEAALKVQNEMRKARGMSVRHWGHYNSWLLYGYLQQGRVEKALELLKAARDEVMAGGATPADSLSLDSDHSLLGSVVQMWARFLIETRGWNSEVADWSFDPGEAYDPALTLVFIRAMTAAESGNALKAEQDLKRFRQLQFALQQEIAKMVEQAPTDLLYLGRLEVMERQIQAAVAWASGDAMQAVELAREASMLEGEMPFSVGPPYVDRPSAEYLGELLLLSENYAEAKVAFETQLERSRQRTNALRGLERAQLGLGDEAGARYTRAKLDRIRFGSGQPARSSE